ncbi:glycosyl hydrolase family 18 protein [Streptomyces sp. NPDC001732]
MFEHMTSRRRTATALAAVLGLLLALLSLQAAPAHAAGKPTATFTSADNGSWWKGTYVLHSDTETAVTGWEIEFDLPAGVTIDTSCNGTVTTRGSHVTAVNAHYNGTVAAHGTSEPYSFWFVAKGPVAAPTGCRVNGDKCDGSADVPPGAPGGLKQTDVTARTASLSWTAAAPGDFPVASYDVLAGGKVVGSATAATSTTVTGPTPATAYAFAVRAKDTRGNTSAESAPLAVTTVGPATDTSPPTAPGSLRSTATDSSSVTLAWTAATDDQRVAAYDIYRGGLLATTVSGATTTATIGGLSPSTPYTFTVKARDAADNASPASGALTVKTDDIVGKGNYAKVGYFVQWGIYGRFSADTAIRAYTDAGVEPRKLTLGVPFHGRGRQNVADGGAAGEWQGAGGAAPGQFAEEAGNRGYADLIGAYPTMTVHHDEQSISTYGYTGNQWWSFDDTWSLGKKTDYVKSKGLLGVMIWEMSGDTSQGTLMNALDTGLKRGLSRPER